ncbi:MAG: thiopurine S-methyltransferase [Motiliproteus sp.]
MDANFWQQRWQQQQIGFHQQLVNPLLSGYWSELGLRPEARVLVPLCGKSRDMLWLLDQGHSVVGVELSEVAAQAFFTENKLQSSACQQAGLQGWQVDALTLLCGDFFALTLSPEALDPENLALETLGLETQGSEKSTEGAVAGKAEEMFDAIYDRAALIALPPSMRTAYVDKLLSVLRPGGQLLLITLEYPPEMHQGPPFSIAEEEVCARFGDRFSVEKLTSETLTREHEDFSRRGLLGSQETVYRLRCLDNPADS